MKTKIRKNFRELRRNMRDDVIKAKTHIINQNLIHFIQEKFPDFASKIFSLYCPVENEVPVSGIRSFFIKNRISFCYPKILGKQFPLQFILFFEGQEFCGNKYYPNLLEPMSGVVTHPDFIITPLVAFDSNLNRMGMGGGFFDRTLQHLRMHNSDTIAIGVAYDSQRCDALPVNELDQHLDYVVSEIGIYRDASKN